MAVSGAYESALGQLSIPYEKFTDQASFNQAVGSADVASTLVALDAFGPHKFPSVTEHIGRGGRVLAQFYAVVENPALATAFGVVVERRTTAPTPVYSWTGSPLLSGLAQPLGFINFAFGEDGQRFHVLPGAYGVAGSGVNPASGQAALVIANTGRTIINGFYSEEFAHSGEAVRLAVNEIAFLTGRVSGTSPLVQIQPRDETAVPGAQITLQLTASGGNPLSYQWFHNGSVVPGATSPVYRIPSVDSSHDGTYHAILSNSWGSVVSQEATLRVSTNGPVRRVLLFIDPVGTLGYPQSVASFLAGRSVEYLTYTDAGSFQRALSEASPHDTLAIVEVPQTPYGFDALAEFVRNGGRAILHFWNMQVARDLANAFGATVQEALANVNPLYKWVDHPISDGLTFPVQFGDLNNISGQRFKLLEGSIGLAGFTRSSTVSQAGIVLGNRGRTLLNGFFIPEILDQGTPAQFAANELNFFFAPTPPVISAGIASNRQGINLSFDTFAGMQYQIERAENPAGPWKPEAGIVSGDGTPKTVILPFGEPQQFYRVRY